MKLKFYYLSLLSLNESTNVEKIVGGLIFGFVGYCVYFDVFVKQLLPKYPKLQLMFNNVQDSKIYFDDVMLNQYEKELLDILPNSVNKSLLSDTFSQLNKSLPFIFEFMSLLRDKNKENMILLQKIPDNLSIFWDVSWNMITLFKQIQDNFKKYNTSEQERFVKKCTEIFFNIMLHFQYQIVEKYELYENIRNLKSSTITQKEIQDLSEIIKILDMNIPYKEKAKLLFQYNRILDENNIFNNNNILYLEYLKYSVIEYKNQLNNITDTNVQNELSQDIQSKQNKIIDSENRIEPELKKLNNTLKDILNQDIQDIFNNIINKILPNKLFKIPELTELLHILPSLQKDLFILKNYKNELLSCIKIFLPLIMINENIKDLVSKIELDQNKEENIKNLQKLLRDNKEILIKHYNIMDNFKEILTKYYSHKIPQDISSDFNDIINHIEKIINNTHCNLLY